MLTVTVTLIPERWDEKNGEFIPPITTALQLEHSLLSLSKWESKWCKPFFSKEEKTFEQTLDYIKCMTLNKNIQPEVYGKLSRENIDEINQYIEAPMTATWFPKDSSGKNNRRVITNELIYYWMIALNIPFECQKWHINRLLTLIRVCNIENQPQKKMSKQEIASRNKALNEQRKRQLNTRG